MTIQAISICNFKGIAQRQDFPLTPITVFVGPNSSGKSSVIHAAVALAQTLKLGNTAPSLVLDDEYAHVHLGRFSEIAHTRNYTSAIEIGVDLGLHELTYHAGQRRTLSGLCTAHYGFKSTLRTQEVYVDTADLRLGDYNLNIKRSAKSPYPYSGTVTDGPRLRMQRANNFKFDPLGELGPPKEDGGADYLKTFFAIRGIQTQVEAELRRTLYLGPFRQSPLRRYPFRGATAIEVGPMGEATVTMLASEYVRAQDRPHVRRVNEWLTYLNLARSVEVSRVGTSDLFDVNLKLPDGNALPIADLGYGLSQVLPILTQCSFAPQHATLLFEQPEIHLHEGAARRLARVFTDTAARTQGHILIETHSKELIQELFNEIRAEKISLENFSIYAVDRVDGASQYTRVPMSWDDGEIIVDHAWAGPLART